MVNVRVSRAQLASSNVCSWMVGSFFDQSHKDNMPASCCAYNCTKRFVKDSGITFHRFPFARPETFAKWIKAVRRANWKPTKNTMLCSLHFEPQCFRHCNDRRYLHENAVPSIFDFPKHLCKQGPVTRSTRIQELELEFSPNYKFTRKRLAPPTREDVQSQTGRQSTTGLQSSTAVHPSSDMESNAGAQSSQGDQPSQNAGEQPKATGVPSTCVQGRQLDHNYICLSPRTLTKQVILLRDKLATTNRTLHSAKRKLFRSNDKIKRQETVIQGLRKKLYSESSTPTFNSYNDVLNEIFQGEHSHDYSESLKKFALTMQFNSPKAYQFLSKYCQLPHPRTLHQWQSTLDNNNDFTK